MTTFACDVRIESVEHQDFGELATVVPTEGDSTASSGIDIRLDGAAQFYMTVDAAQAFPVGAKLKLTISDE